MPEELETQEIEETQETDELEGLDTQLLEESPETVETILVDDQEVSRDDVIDAYRNKEKWTTTNTQHSQENKKAFDEINEERKRLEEDRQYIEQLKRDVELTAKQNYQYQPQQQEQLNGNDQYFGMSQEDFEELAPHEKMILKNQYEQNKAWERFQQQNEQKEFYNQTQAEHGRLQSIYSDYNGKLIEEAIIRGRNQFEDVHLAETYKKILKGDSDTLETFIPDEIKEKYRKEGKDNLIKNLREKEAQKKKIATPTPERGGLSKLPDTTPIKNKSYRDLRGEALRTLEEEKISLFE